MGNRIKFIFLLILSSLVFAPSAFGQSIPQAINYQAIARDGDGNPLSSTDLDVRISILTDVPSMVYVETHQVTTNPLGIFDLIIGDGLAEVGALSDIAWGSFEHFIQIEIARNGADFQVIGNSQLLSVPYAFYALQAGNASNAEVSDSLWRRNANDIFYLEGNVGIGVDNPGSTLSVLSSLEIVGATGAEVVIIHNNESDRANISLLDPDQQEKLAIYINRDREGELIGYNTDGQIVNFITALADGQGFMRVNGPNGNNNITATSLLGEPNNGWLGVGDDNGDPRAQIFVDGNGDGGLVLRNTVDDLSHRAGAFDEGAGWLSIYGGNGSRNIRLTNLSTNGNNGFLTLVDEDDATKASIYVNSSKEGIVTVDNASDDRAALMTAASSGAGYITTEGPNGNENVRLTALSTNGNHGYVGVLDASETIKAGLYVDAGGQGFIFADVKNFVMEHPADEEKEIVYASLEGPEAGAYVRGVGSLTNGSATVLLPEHFQHVVSEQGITVQITSQSAESKGLAVIDRSPTSFTVKELFQGTGNYYFDWEVKAVRKGFEDYEVVRSKEYRKAASKMIDQQPTEGRPNTSDEGKIGSEKNQKTINDQKEEVRPARGGPIGNRVGEIKN